VKPGGSPNRNPVLIYDGSCGLCNRAVRLAARLDEKQRIRFSAYQELGAEELRDFGLTREDCARRLRFVLPGGQVSSGALAVNRFLLVAAPGGPGGWLLRAAAILAFALPPLLLVELLVYEIVARNRRRFGSSDCGVREPSSG